MTSFAYCCYYISFDHHSLLRQIVRQTLDELLEVEGDRRLVIRDSQKLRIESCVVVLRPFDIAPMKKKYELTEYPRTAI